MRAGGPNAFLRAGTGAPAGEGLLRVPGPPWLRPERAACPKDGLRPGAKGGMTLKSIKPGRGPSAMSAVSSVVVVIFGVFWTVMTVQMGAPFFFPLFGLCFIGLGVMQVIYHTRNATRKNRYSTFDITDSSEEPDPLAQRFAPQEEPEPQEGEAQPQEGALFCPYCGAPMQEDYKFCRKCGRQVE